MSIEIDVYVPVFSKDTVRAALKLLSDQGINVELAPDVKLTDPSTWEGFLPMAVNISDYRQSVIPTFISGFELDVLSAAGDLTLERLETAPPELAAKIRESVFLVSINAGVSVPASMPLASAFAGALTEAGHGALFDCESGAFVADLQSLGAILRSDWVEDLDTLGPSDVEPFLGW